VGLRQDDTYGSSTQTGGAQSGGYGGDSYGSSKGTGGVSSLLTLHTGSISDEHLREFRTKTCGSVPTGVHCKTVVDRHVNLGYYR
jgi:hypothetical protein